MLLLMRRTLLFHYSPTRSQPRRERERLREREQRLKRGSCVCVCIKETSCRRPFNVNYLYYCHRIISKDAASSNSKGFIEFILIWFLHTYFCESIFFQSLVQIPFSREYTGSNLIKSDINVAQSTSIFLHGCVGSGQQKFSHQIRIWNCSTNHSHSLNNAPFRIWNLCEMLFSSFFFRILNEQLWPRDDLGGAALPSSGVLWECLCSRLL